MLRNVAVVIMFVVLGFIYGIGGVLIGPWVGVNKQLDNIDLKTAPNYRRVAKYATLIGRAAVYIMITVLIRLMIG